jgi:zinc protease
VNGPVMAGLLTLTCCATEPRLVASLRYEEPGLGAAKRSEDSSRSAAPEASLLMTPVQCPASFDFALDNGLRVVVVERHGFPSVAARMVFPRKPSDRGAADSLRLQIVGATFFSPVEAGQDASASCGRVGCSLAEWGTSGELTAMLGRLAALVANPHESTATYERRRLRAMVDLRLSRQTGTVALERNAYSLAFGASRDGKIDASSPGPQIEEIERTRDSVIYPANATLFVAGDTSLEETRRAVESVFAAWTAKGIAAVQEGPPAVTEDRPGVVLIPWRGVTQTFADVVARGPSRDDDDAPAFVLATEILGGGASSIANRAVREEMAAAYAVGENVAWFETGSVLTLGGALEEGKAVDALRSLLGALRALRTEGPTEKDIQRAKATLRARVRHLGSSNTGLALLLSGSVGANAQLDGCNFANLVLATSAADVHRAATKYFSEGSLHVVALGSPEDVGFGLPDLGLGPVRLRDGFASDVKR